MVGGVVCWLFLPRPDPNVFSIAGAIRLSAFFAAGYLLARVAANWHAERRAGDFRRTGLTMLVCALLASAAVLKAEVGGLELDLSVRRFIALLIGLGSCFALFLIAPSHPRLAAFGRMSYAVYLFHVFFTAAALKLGSALAPGLPPFALWPGAMLAGLFGPVAVQWIVLKWAPTAYAFLGVRRRPVLAGAAAA